jgi:3-dehydroquinate dehydratase-2
MAIILVLQGPNLNLLGKREPKLYGQTTLPQIHQQLQTLGQQLGHSVICKQSNSEGELIDIIQQAGNDHVEFILFNAGAYTHTSIALRDALSSVQIPFIEVHVSNIYARESFRHISYLEDIAVGVICGLGPYGYELALQAANHYLQTKQP